MRTTEIEFTEFRAEHLDETQELAAQAGWANRKDDLSMLLGLGCGYVAIINNHLVGSMCMTFFGEVATIGLLVVDEKMRGQGIGGQLMKLALEKAGKRECRLIATSDGKPLYRKLGFDQLEAAPTHRGVVACVDAPDGAEWATRDDLDQISEIDRRATGLDRRALISTLWNKGVVAVIRHAGKVVGYAAMLRYGSDEVAGPVIACSTYQARRLLSFLFSQRIGALVRVVLRQQSGLAEWLNSIGIAEVSTGTAMRRGKAHADTEAPFRTYVLASSQFGFP
ncbi:GNAT family N-acetyltransferase [Mesorhizobium sangaii]|uniref:Putative N-acetyltransferase YhbS n=1 Tax=Mesorhizobium sangaii TaxID=505389 RepID=A0A841PF17_9HYPH|nr:GNAT family N-acetyltransferase [Mesorhizobium sangaii]MBB6413746.1 putative N-acetyltransferase YhbS [Mesorhizobium sangaii]